MKKFIEILKIILECIGISIVGIGTVIMGVIGIIGIILLRNLGFIIVIVMTAFILKWVFGL